MFSVSLEELDLSNTSLEVFSNPLHSYILLKTASFLCSSAPLDELPHLQELKLDSKQLIILLKEIDSYEHSGGA